MFGNKYREALFEAKIELAELRIKNEAITREADTSRRNFENALATVVALQKSIADLERDKAVLMERLDLLANHLTPEPQAFSLSEDEEDARWALDKGVINQSQFESILAEAGAINTEIHFDAEDYPRLSAVK